MRLDDRFKQTIENIKDPLFNVLIGYELIFMLASTFLVINV